MAGVCLSLGPAVSGCAGPIEYVSQVSRAASAVAAAKEVDAETWAPYEYTAATEYLHWSREVAGYSRYQLAIDYGKQAEVLGTKAHDLALQRRAEPNAKPPGPPPETGASAPTGEPPAAAVSIVPVPSPPQSSPASAPARGSP